MISNDKPLSYAEQDQIDAVLARKNGGYIQTFSALDGMLAAVVCAPDMIMPSEYLEIIQEGETEDDHLSFKDEKEAEEFFRLIMRHYNTVLSCIRDFGEVVEGEYVFYTPSLLEDENSHVVTEEWAKGFLTGTHLRHEEWARFTDAARYPDGEESPLLSTLLLAYENHPDPELRPFNKPLTNELRQQLVATAVIGIKEIYDVFSAERGLFQGRTYQLDDAPGVFMRSQPKVGRNDPCPCGSGKKFKKCCAALKVVP